MEGWCSPAKATKLASYASYARTFVEIGVFGGKSLFAGALSQPSGSIAIGIDPWESIPSVEGYDGENATWWSKIDHEAIYRSCRTFQTSLDLVRSCFLVRATASEALPLAERFSPIDLLHIDGNHSESASLHDVTHYVPLVRLGGIVFFDDLSWETTRRAQEHLARLCRPIDEVDGCGVFERL
jgi:hypothetical protein